MTEDGQSRAAHSVPMINRAIVVGLTEAKGLIADYVEHLQDAEYVGGVFALADIVAIDGLLAAMLRSDNRAEVGQAHLFVEDAVRFGLAPLFGRYLRRSQILQALRANLRTDDYFTRCQAIHTLGRIGPRANAQYLARNFAWYLERDPLNLEDLLGELFGLGHSVPVQHYLDEMARAESYLARWALVELLWTDDFCLDQLAPHGLSDYVRILLLRLTEDLHPVVRAEARWRQELRPSDHPRTPGLAHSESANKPDPSFLTLKLNLRNFLGFSGRRDYDLTLVEQVTTYLREHPITLGYDFEAYWRAFAARA